MNISVAQFEFARLHLLEKIEECKFKRRQRLLLTVIRLGSINRLRPRLYVPNLDRFSLWGGPSDRAEVSRAIDELEGMYVIQAPRRNALGARLAGWYGINMLLEAWNVPRRESWPADEQMWFEGIQERDLVDALFETFVEFGGLPPKLPPGVELTRAGLPGTLESGGVRDTSRASVEGAETADPSGVAARDASGSRAPARLSSEPRAAAGQGPTVGKIPTPPAELPPPSVGNSPTGSVSPRVYRAETVAVGKIPTGYSQPLGKSQRASGNPPPCTPPVEITKDHGSTALSEDQRNKGIFEDQRARARGALGKSQRPVTWAEQRDLEELLRRWVGDEDMQRMGERFWVPKVIRNFPNAVAYCVGKLQRLEQRQPGYFRGCSPAEVQAHKIKVLVRDIRTETGVRTWQDVPAGPEPTEQ